MVVKRFRADRLFPSVPSKLRETIQLLCITSEKTSMFRPDLFLRSTPVQHMTHSHSTSRVLSHTEAENDTTRCLATKWGEARRKVLLAFKAWPLWRPREINGCYRWRKSGSRCANLNCFNNSAERTYIVNSMGLRWCCVECHVQRRKYQKQITKFLSFQSPKVPPHLTYTNSTFCPHPIFMCFLSENKQRLFPYSALTDWFL
jgi:hypothetical protein